MVTLLPGKCCDHRDRQEDREVRQYQQQNLPRSDCIRDQREYQLQQAQIFY